MRVHTGVGVDRAGLPHHDASGRGGERAAPVDGERRRPGDPGGKDGQPRRRAERLRGGCEESEGPRRRGHGWGKTGGRDEMLARLDWIGAGLLARSLRVGSVRTQLCAARVVRRDVSGTPVQEGINRCSVN